MEKVEARLFGGTRGRRCRGRHPHFVDQHLLVADGTVGCDLAGSPR